MAFILSNAVRWEERSPGVAVKMMVGAGVGAAGIGMGMAEIQPGQGLVLHYHHVEEAIMVVEGSGLVVDGDKTYPATAGDAVLATAGVGHKVVNNSDKPLKIVFAYPSLDPGRVVLE